MNNFKQFYKRSIEERKAILDNTFQIDPNNYKELDIELANHMVENAISTYEVPLGLATNFRVNNRNYIIPMATEEPSVIAAASNGAKIVALNGGFTTSVPNRSMIGQTAFYNPKNHENMELYLKYNLEKLKNIAIAAHPSIHNRGGGLVSITSKLIKEPNKTTFFVVYFTIDTKEAMGANIINTILEAIKPHLESTFKCPSIMSIISNYATESLVSASCTIDPKLSGMTDEQCELIAIASDLASVDIYRTTTHNKGIMIGISAVTLASGNDTRAIEAGAHAYASHSGTYQPLATWKFENDKLEGTITLPLALGSVGGSISIHPKARLFHQIINTQNAQELMQVTAAVGLAQNFAALKALTSVGIQKGHMSLQAKSLLLSVGITQDELPQALELLKEKTVMNSQTAIEIREFLRQR